MGYITINNLYKYNDILLFKECYALEKIHGTSAFIEWKDNKIHFHSNENSRNLKSLFDTDLLSNKLSVNFSNVPIKIYGEHYGGKIQKMSNTYGKNTKFVAFDISINNMWLSVPKAENVANSLGLEFVHYVKILTNLEEIDNQMNADSVQAVRNGIGSGKMREGVVLRPLIELTRNDGARIICKHKRKEFSERKHVPKIADLGKLEVLTKASDIANEWVVEMRLDHILQELPDAIGIEHTGIVIKAMIADVYKEAKDEIVESREVSSAIGRKAASLWKKRLGA